MSKVEDTLWGDLIRAPEAELALARRQPRERILVTARALLTAAAFVGIALVIAVVVLASAGTSGDPAYALTRSADGSVTLSVSELVGVSGANQRLAGLGLPVVVARMESGCAAAGEVVESSTAGEHDIVEPQPPGPTGLAWVIRPAAIPPGDTVQISLRYANHPANLGGQSGPALLGSWAIFRGEAPSCLRPEAPGP